MQSQKPVSVYLQSKQILPFDVMDKYTRVTAISSDAPGRGQSSPS